MLKAPLNNFSLRRSVAEVGYVAWATRLRPRKPADHFVTSVNGSRRRFQLWRTKPAYAPSELRRTKYISNSPVPFACTLPRGVKWNRLPACSRSSAYVLSLMFTCPTSPDDSMRLAVFTVSPRMSYWNYFTPTMPATTGPLWMPTRISKNVLPLEDPPEGHAVAALR